MTPERDFRIAFFGTPEFAVPTIDLLAESCHVIVAVTQPDRPKGRGQRSYAPPVKQRAEARGIPVLQPERLRDQSFLDSLRGLRPDLGVVAAYGKILPQDVLALPRLGMVNVHASILPKYRGAAPVHRAVMHGDTETGVTIMRVVTALDAGPMLSIARRSIGPDETSEEVERDLASVGARLLLETLPDIARGTAVETPQDNALATYAPRLTKAEGRIDWLEPASVIHNNVRGLYPWPHAYTFLRETRLIILATAVDQRLHEAAPPGSIVRAAGDEWHVAAGDQTWLQIHMVQTEGRRPMTTRAFLAGHPVNVGAILE